MISSVPPVTVVRAANSRVPSALTRSTSMEAPGAAGMAMTCVVPLSMSMTAMSGRSSPVRAT